LDEGPSKPADWYPTRFVLPPIWRLALVVLAQLGLGAVAVAFLKQQWVSIVFILVMLVASAVWQWRGSARPDLSREDDIPTMGSARSKP
jgi:CHASE2 domain-containing sensor protein